MKRKFFLALLLITSLIGYTEWGGGQHAYLFQIEADLLKKLFTSPQDLVHPFVILPFIGQVILVYALLKKNTPKWLEYSGVVFMGILLLMLLLVGILAKDAKIICCSLPYILIAIGFFITGKRG